jgi:hypothetical protein
MLLASEPADTKGWNLEQKIHKKGRRENYIGD